MEDSLWIQEGLSMRHLIISKVAMMFSSIYAMLMVGFMKDECYSMVAMAGALMLFFEGVSIVQRNKFRDGETK